VCCCFAALRQLRSIRHLVSATIFQSLVAFTYDSWRTLPTSLLRTDSGPQSQTVCSFLLSDFLLSVAAPSLSLMLVCGTTYRRTLPPHRRCSHLSRDRKCTYFVIHTLDYHQLFLPYIYSGVFRPIVAVCCLGHVKIWLIDWLIEAGRRCG